MKIHFSAHTINLSIQSMKMTFDMQVSPRGHQRQAINSGARHKDHDKSKRQIQHTLQQAHHLFGNNCACLTSQLCAKEWGQKDEELNELTCPV